MSDPYKEYRDLQMFTGKVKELLETIEWSGDPFFYSCPYCQHDRRDGHDKGCKLMELKNG